MKIEIKSETDTGTSSILFDNESYITENYISVFFDETEHTISVQDLYLAAQVFEKIRRESMNIERGTA